MILIPKINELSRKREEAGLSRHKLAQKAGLGGSAISRIESGSSRHVYLLRAKAIAEALNCEVGDLFMEEKEDAELTEGLERFHEQTGGNKMLKWKRTPQGEYESNVQYWDEESGVHKPVYVILKSESVFVLYVRGKLHIIERGFSKLLNREITITHFVKLKYAKKAAQLMENENLVYQTEEEKGFAEGGGWSGATWITGEGRGGAWHTDQNGNIVEG